MNTMKIKFRDNAGYYSCTWDYDTIEHLWAMIAKEERDYESNFVQFITD